MSNKQRKIGSGFESLEERAMMAADIFDLRTSVPTISSDRIVESSYVQFEANRGVALSAANISQPVDNRVVQSERAADGTLYELTVPGHIYETRLGGSRQLILAPVNDPGTAAVQMELSSNGTLYALNQRGHIYQRSPGGSWQLILAPVNDPGTAAVQMELSSNGTLYALNQRGHIYQRSPGGSWQLILAPPVNDPGTAAVQMELSSDGTLYELNQKGHIYQRLPGGSWQLILAPVNDPGTAAVQMELSSNGTLYALNQRGHIYQRSPGGSWQLILAPVNDPGTAAVQMELSSNGTLYALNQRGHIYQRSPGGSWQLILAPVNDPGTAAVQMELSSNGTLYALNQRGHIYQRSPGGSWQLILAPVNDPGTAAVEMALGKDGTLYELNQRGHVYQRRSGAGWTLVRSNVRDFAVDSLDRVFFASSEGDPSMVLKSAAVGTISHATAIKQNNVLKIFGTGNHDQIVLNKTLGYLTVAGASFSSSDVARDVFVHQLRGIRVYAGAGNDVVDLSSVDQGAEVYGGVGNDTLNGGRGNDALYGGADNDRLKGDSGNDNLYGGADDDGLYGGDGHDHLFGEEGNDGLFGGLSHGIYVDHLDGGTGNDRFLLEVGSRGGQRVPGSGDDVLLNFRHGSLALGLDWNNREIEEIDKAFAELQNKVRGETWIFWDYGTGDPLCFQKYIPAKPNEYGLNSHSSGFFEADRTIFIREWDETIDSENESRRKTVIHEIGHNWDGGDVVFGREFNPFWEEFARLNNMSYKFDPDLKVENHASPDFARDYGQDNSTDDWCTVWELYFGYIPGPSSPSPILQAKLDIVDAFFSLTANQLRDLYRASLLS